MTVQELRALLPADEDLEIDGDTEGEVPAEGTEEQTGNPPSDNPAGDDVDLE